MFMKNSSPEKQKLYIFPVLPLTMFYLSVKISDGLFSHYNHKLCYLSIINLQMTFISRFTPLLFLYFYVGLPVFHLFIIHLYKTEFHYCTLSFITAHFVHHCTLKQALEVLKDAQLQTPSTIAV